ncbi:MAG: ABC transporter substrate-binding protein [Rhodobacteraceae bacterium]|nr:ABC transporter substrate-binding protein [Paracoccaceae bacterium]
MHFLTILLPLVVVAAPALADPVSVRSCEREIMFEEPPKAAVANDVNMVEMMLALGLAERMVGYTGVSGWKTLDAELRRGIGELPELSPRYPSREVLVAAGTDFYFAGWNYGMRVGGEVTPDSLEPFGIAVYELTESCIHVGPRPGISMQDMYRDLLNLGRIFAIEERAGALVDSYRSELEALLASLPPLDQPPAVFVYDSGEDVPFTAGKYAMPTALIEAAGGRNIMNDLEKSWATVGWESVVDRDPEIILIVNYGEVSAGQKQDFLKSHPGLAGIDAVRNDRFVVLEYVEATPGPRNIPAIAKLAAAFRDGLR